MTATFDVADTLHRLVKEALDSGAAQTLGDAASGFISLSPKLRQPTLNIKLPCLLEWRSRDVFSSEE
jgi:hypothetical protein